MIDFAANLAGQPLRAHERLDPDVSVQQELHRHRIFFTPSKAPTGPTMSPTISPESRMHPNQDWCVLEVGGTTSATGFPRLVIRTGRRLLLTSSRTARQLALNLEIAISILHQLLH